MQNPFQHQLDAWRSSRAKVAIERDLARKARQEAYTAIAKAWAASWALLVRRGLILCTVVALAWFFWPWPATEKTTHAKTPRKTSAKK